MNEAANATAGQAGGFKAWMRHLRQHLFARLCNPGLLLALLFFAASLTPSMTPRFAIAQGVLSGLCLAIGYALGVLLYWTWRYMELPLPGMAGEPLRRKLVVLGGGAIAAFALWRSQHWDNLVRELMHLPPADHWRAVTLLVVAVVLAAVLLVLGRAALILIQAVKRLVVGWVPRRIAHVAGFIAGVLLLVGLVNGVVVSSILDMLDESYRQRDALIPPDMPPPRTTSLRRSGSPAMPGRGNSM